jgi:hypothetical protein
LLIVLAEFFVNAAQRERKRKREEEREKERERERERESKLISGSRNKYGSNVSSGRGRALIHGDSKVCLAG